MEITTQPLLTFLQLIDRIIDIDVELAIDSAEQRYRHRLDRRSWQEQISHWHKKLLGEPLQLLKSRSIQTIHPLFYLRMLLKIRTAILT